MTVIERESSRQSKLVTVNGVGEVISVSEHPRLHADLSGGVDVNRASGEQLTAAKGLCTVGFKLYGEGFVLAAEEATRIIEADSRNADVMRPYRIASDLTRRPRGNYVIDFGSRSESDSREYEVAFNLVRARVKPHRDANPNPDIAARWWQHGHLRPQLREAVRDLAFFIATPETSKHRFFEMLDSTIAPEGSIVCIASDDFSVLGVLSSETHHAWFRAVAGKMGVGNDFRYNKRCFDSFPFPPEHDGDVAEIAAAIDAHRKSALQRDAELTMTGIYNVIQKIRAKVALSVKERRIHDSGACGVLLDLHDKLDAQVAQAYGWPWPMTRDEIIERLVALHDERVTEEMGGHIRWLRPDYQIPRFAPDAPVQELALKSEKPLPRVSGPGAAAIAWPSQSVEQLSAVKSVASRVGTDPDAIAAVFSGANEKMLRRHLETLSMMGELN